MKYFLIAPLAKRNRKSLRAAEKSLTAQRYANRDAKTDIIYGA